MLERSLKLKIQLIVVGMKVLRHMTFNLGANMQTLYPKGVTDPLSRNITFKAGNGVMKQMVETPDQMSGSGITAIVRNMAADDVI